MRRVLGNFGLLLRGRGIAAVMLFGTTTLMARALGPAEFGLVVLIQTYTLLIRGLFNFQLFDVVVRYGVPSHDDDDAHTLQRLIKICRRVDSLVRVLATVLALILTPLIGPLLGMEQDHMILLSLYSLVLLATGNGTDIGVLRLFDQFDILGRQMTIGPFLSLFGVVIAWWLNSPLPVFIVILAFAYATENIYLSWCGRRECRQRIGSPNQDKSLKKASMDEFPGLRHFLWISYWQSNLDLVPKHITVMLAGLLLGATEAGLLRLARQFSSLLSKPAVLIRQVVFLDLNRSWNQGNPNFKLIAYRTALLGGGVGMLFVLAGYFFGEVLLETIIGQEFVAAAPVLTLMLLAATFDLTASSLRSAAYASGHTGKVLRLYVLSAFIYLTLFVLLTSWIGLIGAGVAASCAAIIPPLFMLALIHKEGHQKT